MTTRQPIVSVLGHVDHGKTMLLDRIRGTSVVSREAGAITQQLGATEVPIDHIYDVCSQLISERNFTVPGLLFIDTPGHHSFTTLRARGGSLADMAILVIDVREGLMPQTIESIRILRRLKTPFIIALNKIDSIPGWESQPNTPFVLSARKQSERALQELDLKLYNIIGRLNEEDLSAERYDRIGDFTKAIAMVPLSAKTGEGVSDLLLVLIGLAQRFLEGQLEMEERGPGRGTILEIKEEKGLGPTLDVILYAGTLRKGDKVALGTRSKPVVTRIKAILRPKPLDEIRDPRDRFDQVNEVSAAIGVKLSCQHIEGVMAGGPLRVIHDNEDQVLAEMTEETKVNIKLSDSGVMIKADAIGSLEALAYECDAAGVLIRKSGIGDVSRRDIIETSAYGDPFHKVILAFNVAVNPDAKEAMHDADMHMFASDIVYRIIEDFQEWEAKERRKIDDEKRSKFAFPGKMMIMPNHVFRASKPAIVGVRVLSGRIRPGQRLVGVDGRDLGRIRSIRDGEEPMREAKQGAEVAVAIEGITIGRQVDAEGILYVDLMETAAKELRSYDLNADEAMTLDELLVIKRKQDPFWAM